MKIFDIRTYKNNKMKKMYSFEKVDDMLKWKGRTQTHVI